MFKKFTNGCVRVVNRWLPDAFLFAIILSIIVFIGSMCATKMGPLQVLNAWGDQWTNMIQPFWALPALGIAKLSARDIMGYLVIVTLFVGVVACLGFLAWAAWF